ncbi:MAG TPA: biotin-dependent carboxyltransferase family protein [Candidatus Limnocylindrales bacterium]|nr:biotin-dependent carboxyltransferase family protein [Candidatus Limnocylindrales bacterium]
MSQEILEVLDPGLLTTIQDGGRFGYEADGVPQSGAADLIGLAIANVLLGNEPDAAGLELTLLGPRLRALVDVDLALGGADLAAAIERGAPGGGQRTTRERAPTGSTIRLRAGDVLAVGGRPDEPGAGCRAYLAAPGGVEVPLVLDSRSTCLPAGFGGLDGRALRAGDRIAAQGAGGRPERRLATRRLAEIPSPAQRIRVLPGPASGDGDPAFAGLIERVWLVAPESDRRGLRLEPAADPDGLARLAPLAAGELPSHGVLPGSVQVTPSGQPLVLMPDAGTTGGYPVVAVVISADLPILGQLAPGAEVRFRATDADAARDAELERRRFLAALADLP